MDCAKIGQLILTLRKEKGLTQQQIAERLGISNKTVSKWECGLGCPDVTLLEQLSSVLDADIPQLLKGKLCQNQPDPGKIGLTRFYVCPGCGNILFSTGKADISCCGRRLSPLDSVLPLQSHEITFEETDIEYYVTINHDMSKDHYLSFAAYVSDYRIFFYRLYPEQNPEIRLPLIPGGTLYLYCIRHGLLKYRL